MSIINAAIQDSTSMYYFFNRSLDILRVIWYLKSEMNNAFGSRIVSESATALARFEFFVNRFHSAKVMVAFYTNTIISSSRISQISIWIRGRYKSHLICYFHNVSFSLHRIAYHFLSADICRDVYNWIVKPIGYLLHYFFGSKKYSTNCASTLLSYCVTAFISTARARRSDTSHTFKELPLVSFWRFPV